MADRSLTTLLGIDHPIALAPFGGLSSVELTAAVSELGGLGAYGFYGYDGARIEATLRELHAATSKPFAANLWLPTGDEVAPGEVDLERYRPTLEDFFTEVGLEWPSPPQRFLPEFGDQLDALLAQPPAVFSFVYGVPEAKVIDKVHAVGSAVIGTATTVAEAQALEAGGVDAIVATGAEAAGHRTSFLAAPRDSVVGTFSLVPQVVDAVTVPVLAAGGVAERRTVAAAFALGASGVHVGTAFLATEESAANDAHRAAIAATKPEETVLTEAMSGRLSRGAKNRAIETIEAGVRGPFPAQNWLTGQFRKVAGVLGRGELQSLWLGQSAPLAKYRSAAGVMAELLAGVPGSR